MSFCIHLGEYRGTVELCRPTQTSVRIKRSFVSNACEVHGRCLPMLKDWPGWNEMPESKIFARCQSCPERKTQ